jgi:hypothetical protein
MKRFFTLTMIVLAVMLVLVPVSFAGAVETSNALGEGISGFLTNTFIPLVVAIVGLLVSIVLMKIRQKFNIQISAETEAFIRRQAENAVQLVAEKAAQKVKSSGIKLSGNQKLDMAVGLLLTKVPKISKDQADAYVHAALARIRGEGATGIALKPEY